MKPIILDRTRLEQYANCPFQGYVMTLWDALKAKAEGREVFAWEQERLLNADPELIEMLSAVAQQSIMGKFADCGIEIHALLERAFKECEGDLEAIPEWFVENLPGIKPNIQPMAIRHARHAADMLADYHVAVIGTEVQVSMVLTEETDSTPAIIGTTAIDLLGSGKDSLHVCDYKTGFKRRSNTETLDSFQAGFIAALLFSQPEYAEINTIHFWYYETMHGTKAYARFDRHAEHPRLPNLTTEMALKGRIREAVKLFEADCRECWPLPDTCAWCDVIRFCPYASIEAKEIADDPSGFVDSMVVMEQRLKAMKKAATAWIKAKGEIAGTKVVFAKKVPQERFTGGFQDKQKPKGPAETGVSELDSHFK